MSQQLASFDLHMVWEKNFSLKFYLSATAISYDITRFVVYYTKNFNNWYSCFTVYNKPKKGETYGYSRTWNESRPGDTIGMRLRVYSPETGYVNSPDLLGTFTLPDGVLKPAKLITNTSASIPITITTDSNGNFGSTIFYKKHSDSDYKHVSTDLKTRDAGIYTLNHSLIYLSPNTLYDYYGTINFAWADNIPLGPLNFFTGIRSFRYRAFGVKPDQSDVYGEYKYFDYPPL